MCQSQPQLGESSGERQALAETSSSRVCVWREPEPAKSGSLRDLPVVHRSLRDCEVQDRPKAANARVGRRKPTVGKERDMALFTTFMQRVEAITLDGFAALGLLAGFVVATLQELRSGHPATAWELVRAVR